MNNRFPISNDIAHFSDSQPSGDEPKTPSDSDLLRLAVERRFRPWFNVKTRRQVQVVVWDLERQIELPVPIDYEKGARAMLETGIDLGISQSLDILELVRGWSRDIPFEEQLVLIGQGIHIMDNRLLVISGKRIISFDPETSLWKELSPPLLRGFRPQLQSDEWLPWTIEQLNSPAPYPLDLTMIALVNSIGVSWKFELGEVDALLHALTMGALILGCLWRQQPILHINAKSSSGKSRLLSLYTGTAPLLNGKALVPNHVFVTDASAPGVIARLRESRLHLIVDEAEPSASDRIDDLLVLLRAGSGSGSKVLRAYQDGSPRSAFIQFGGLGA